MKKLFLFIYSLSCLGMGVAKAQQFTYMLNFNGISSPQGANPYGSLTLSGNTLYGMTFMGGANNFGCVFSVHTGGSGYKDLLDFNGTNGSNPYGSLTISGGELFGMTFYGGAYGNGRIFSLDTNGKDYKDLYDFNPSNPLGVNPKGSLTLLDNVLYGMTSGGGSNSDGVIFSIDSDGSNYNVLLNFLGPNGAEPWGSLTQWGTTLYGMTYGGGANDSGCVFSIQTNGTGYFDILDLNSTTGIESYGDVVISGNVLYGMTSRGVANTYYGTIFSVHTDGSTFTDLLNFSGTSFSPQGANPHGSLTLSGNTLYGMTSLGGANGSGCAFSIDTNGGEYTDLINFGVAIMAKNPYGNLTLSGGVLYGMTEAGSQVEGLSDGVLFSSGICGLLTATASAIAPVSCNGANDGNAGVTVSGGPTPYTYSWSNGGTSAVSTNNPTGPILSEGEYTVTVTDNNGCVYQTSINFRQPAVLSGSASTSANVSCYSENTGSASVNPSGGTSPYIYSWSNGTTTSSTGAILSASTYTVTVTDNNGCSNTSSVTITQPAIALTATVTVTANLTCNDVNTGEAIVSASGGTSSYNYSWLPNGATKSTASKLSAGTYTVTVTDNNGCSVTASAIITQPNDLLANASVIANVSCDSGTNASAMASPSGGTSPYIYSWSNGITSNSTGAILSAGTYKVTVTDNNGCSVTASAIITQPNDLLANASVIANVSCDSGTNASAMASPSGGTSPYIYSWSNGITSNSTGAILSAGTYKVTVTDNNGCIATSSTTVTQPTAMTVTPYSVAATSGCNGIAAVSPIGGTSPYNYLWLTGNQMTDTIKSQCTGNYCCIITDDNGCTQTTCVKVAKSTTGIENISNSSSVNIYPDPNNGQFIIQSAGINGKSFVEVYNVLGEKVYYGTLNLNITQINLNNQPAGLYLYRVITEQGQLISSGKFIIQ